MRRIRCAAIAKKWVRLCQLNPALIDQLEIGLVDKGRGRKGMVAALAPKVAAGEPPQLAVDGVEQVRARAAVALAPRREQRGQVGFAHDPPDEMVIPQARRDDTDSPAFTRFPYRVPRPERQEGRSCAETIGWAVQSS